MPHVPGHAPLPWSVPALPSGCREILRPGVLETLHFLSVPQQWPFSSLFPCPHKVPLTHSQGIALWHWPFRNSPNRAAAKLCAAFTEKKTASSKPWVSRVETESRESGASLDPRMSHQPAIYSGALSAGEGRKSKAQRKCFLWFTHHSLPRILQGPYQGWEPVPPMHGHRSCTPCFIFPSHDDATIVSFLSSLIPEAPVPGHGRGARGTGPVVAFPDSRSQAMGTAAMTLI